MKNLIDIHTHSVSCSHAYSTIKENYDRAKELGFTYMALVNMDMLWMQV